MHLSDLAKRVAALRGMSTADAADELADLVDDLEAMAANKAVAGDTAVSLLMRALRSIRPRAPYQPDRHAALAALREAVSTGTQED